MKKLRLLRWADDLGLWRWAFNVITMVRFRRSKKKEGDVTSESVLAKVM